jgi:hypothetical protein
MASKPTLGDILGTPTNYTDTPPPINNPATVLILTLCFLVSHGDLNFTSVIAMTSVCFGAGGSGLFGSVS